MKDKSGSLLNDILDPPTNFSLNVSRDIRVNNTYSPYQALGNTALSGRDRASLVLGKLLYSSNVKD